jgi:hypothetical protein
MRRIVSFLSEGGREVTDFFVGNLVTSVKKIVRPFFYYLSLLLVSLSVGEKC